VAELAHPSVQVAPTRIRGGYVGLADAKPRNSVTRPSTPWHTVVTVVDPKALCAVINPAPLMVSTLRLSDRQFVQVDVTSRVVPFSKTPIAVICAVAPTSVSDENAAEKMTV
jgi:hypothetical protein